MEEKEFDEALRDLPDGFNKPPAPPLEEMWAVIEDAHFNAPVAVTPRNRTPSLMPWLAAAATLVLGIGIGRNLPSAEEKAAGEQTTLTATGSTTRATDTSAVVDAYREETSRYLGETAALLISLPEENTTDRSGERFAGKAADLLVTTRLLMDSPAAQDPALRSLLEDLELVLVQIARLRVERNRSDIDLIHQTVEQGDVLSRLNSVVATNQSSE